ncbi:MAG: phage head morphogenesis protein, partial [Candidatus Accumulibacter sp.]|nr:phage head morphogenesis protein [Accumulibacter sp.]
NEIVARRGWTGWTGEGTKRGVAWRTRIIFETNLITSQAAGRYAQLTDPAFLEAYPYWQYIHNDSVLHPRPLHKQWGDQRLTLRHDHPFYKTHCPPNGWLCRCYVKAVAEPPSGAATEPPAGWDTPNLKTGLPPGIDKGWAYAPGASVAGELQKLINDKAAKLSAPLAQSFVAVAQPWNPQTPAGQWHDAAFFNAPENIRRTIAKVGDPKVVLKTPKTSAYCRPNTYIEMDGYSEKTLYGQSTWRHEYGHHVDTTVGKQNNRGYASEDVDFVAAMKKDSRALVTAGAHGKTRSNLKRRSLLDAAYQTSHAEFLAAPDKDVWLADRYKKAGLAYAQTQIDVEKHAEFPMLLQGVGKADRYRRIVVAFENDDAQELMDALTGGIKNRQEWEATFDKGLLGDLSDLFGSVTRNKVCGIYKSGFGHDNAYYGKKPSRAGTEVFANLFDIHGENGLFWRWIVERMLPETNRAFLGWLK